MLRKLEFHREGGSPKHLTDIRAIRDVTGLDLAVLQPWIDRLGLAATWNEANAR